MLIAAQFANLPAFPFSSNPLRPMALSHSIYDSPVFLQACHQFDAAADIIGMDAGVRERAKYPRRTLIVTLPVRMDSGKVETFEGYRVQHNISTGPAKDRKSTRLNSSHIQKSRMPSSA